MSAQELGRHPLLCPTFPIFSLVSALGASLPSSLPRGRHATYLMNPTPAFQCGPISFRLSRLTTIRPSCLPPYRLIASSLPCFIRGTPASCAHGGSHRMVAGLCPFSPSMGYRPDHCQSYRRNLSPSRPLHRPGQLSSLRRCQLTLYRPSALLTHTSLARPVLDCPQGDA